MELYIEKEFLDNFYLVFDQEKPSPTQKILRSIFREYGDKKCFINYTVNSPVELELLKLDNPFFAELSTHFPPIEISDIKEHYFQHSNNLQTLIFYKTNQDWFEEAHDRGAICITFDNYEEEIRNFIESCHFRADLSEYFSGWDLFKPLQRMPFNFIKINDNYILTDKSNQKMDNNIIPLMKELLLNRNSETKIQVYTKDFNNLKKGDVADFNDTALKRHNKLNSGLANFNKSIQTINNDLPSQHDLHDRVILSNYFMIDSGKGFNLLPFKKSNSQIISESIFSKYTYKRLKNHLKMLDDYCKEINKKESVYFKSIGNA